MSIYGSYNNNSINRSVIVEDTLFENCNARYGVKISDTAGITFRGCTFAHDVNLANLGPPAAGYMQAKFFGLSSGKSAAFENCTFSNLRGSYAEDYIFNTWRTYPNTPGSSDPGGTVGSGVGNLTLIGCEFNFINAGSAGLCALYGGQTTPSPAIAPDYLLMDNVTINNSGGQQPLIWLRNAPNGTSTAGTFRFKPNNKYNTTTFTAANIQSVLGSFLRLDNVATPTAAP